MKHTKGPWDVRPTYVDGNIYRLWDKEGNFPEDISAEAMDSNARLIEAAPDMFEALRIVRNCKVNPDGSLVLGTYEREVIKNAFDKARGQ